MKKIIYLLSLLFVITSTIQGQEIEELNFLFNKEWKYDPSTMDVAAKNAYETLLSLTKGNKEVKHLKKNKESIIKYYEEELPSLTVAFNANNELIQKMGRKSIKENWTYDSTTKTIYYIDSDTKKKIALTILELTASKFRFKNQLGFESTLLPAAEVKEPILDTVALEKDLGIYREIVETAHTGMYLYTSKETFDTLFEEAYKKIPTLQNIREFYQLITEIHTKINCGHSSFYPTESIFTEIKSESAHNFFPIKTKFLKDTLVIAQDYENLKKGTQIISINGNTIKKITTETFKLLSSDGYNTTFKYRQLEDDFSTNYFLAFGPQDKFVIEYISASEKQPKIIEVSGISIQELENTITETHFEKPYYLEYMDNNTALLTVNTFSTETKSNQKKFFKFLKTSFQEINNKGIQNLILDIRENTGGDDGNDMELASYFIDTHFKENKFRKLNTLEQLPPFPQYLLPQWFEMLGINPDISPEKIQQKVKNQISTQMHKGTDGAYYWNDSDVIHRDPAKNKFEGNVYILTSGKVFSGGGLFSALVRDKSDAVFIGEETGGGFYRHTGTIPLYYNLPNSKLVFSIFIVINEQDVDKKLFPKGSGTKPHHTVYPTIKEFIEGTDAVLEKAKLQIQSSK